MRRYRGSAFRQLAGIGIVLALLLLSPISPAAAAGPSDVIRGFYGVLLDTMQHAQQLGARGRYQKLEPVIFRTFDVPYMAKLSIGPGWNALTPEQKKQAAHAYGRYIAATYASRFDGYSGERLDVTGEQKIKRGTMVQSGTISELATKRSEFATILRTNGIDGLIASLNKKADDLRG